MPVPAAVFLTICQLWLFVFGAIVGSFLNVVVYRVPRKQFFKNQRSFCPQCGHDLGAIDLLPLFGYLSLGGSCRYCKAKISRRYPLVELLCALVALLCFWRFGFTQETPFVFFLSMVLVALALVDWDTMEIPDGFHLALLPFALCAIWLWPQVGLAARLLGCVVVALPLLLLTLVIKDAFGGGDIKLMVVCGFLLGWKLTLLAFFIALLAAGTWGTYLILAKKGERKMHIPFGPALCLGVFCALLWGNHLLRWYFAFF